MANIVKRDFDWELLKKLTDDIPYGLERRKAKNIREETKRIVRERDKVCRLCGRENSVDSESHSILHVHHIIPNGESTEDNLILLCKYCHQTVHNILYVTGKWRFANTLRIIRW